MKPLFFPLATSILFSGSFIAAKYTTRELGPFTTTLLRYVTALILLTALLVWKKQTLPKPDIREWVFFFLLGLLGIAGYHYFFFTSLKHTSVANTAVINALSPVFTAFFAAILIRERLKIRNYVGVFLACAGVMVLLSGGQIIKIIQFSWNRGDILMLRAVLCWVGYALLIRRAGDRYSSLILTFLTTLFGVGILIVPAFAEGLITQSRTMTAPSIWAVGYMGIGASGLGYLFYNQSIQTMGPTRTASVVYSLVPILVAVLAHVFFGEPVTVIMGISMVFIMLGLRLMLGNSKPV